MQKEWFFDKSQTKQMEAFIRNILAEDGRSSGTVGLFLGYASETGEIVEHSPISVHMPMTKGHADILAVLSSLCQELDGKFAASDLQVRVMRFDNYVDEPRTTTYHGHTAGFFTDDEWAARAL